MKQVAEWEVEEEGKEAGEEEALQEMDEVRMNQDLRYGWQWDESVIKIQVIRQKKKGVKIEVITA